MRSRRSCKHGSGPRSGRLLIGLPIYVPLLTVVQRLAQVSFRDLQSLQSSGCIRNCCVSRFVTELLCVVGCYVGDLFAANLFSFYILGILLCLNTFQIF